MENPNVGEQPFSDKCSTCDGPPASCWCVDCNEALCEACLSAHRRVTITKSHQILSQPPQGARPPQPTRFCRLHPSESLKLFCFTCQQLTCRDCQLISHMNHKYVFISEAVIGLKRKLDLLIQPITELGDRMKQNLQDMETRLKDVSEREALLKARLEDSYNLLTLHLKERMKQLLKKAKEVDDAESRLLRDRMEKMKQAQQLQHYVTKIAEQAKGSEQVSHLSSYITFVKTQMKTLFKESLSPPQTMSQVEVVSGRPALEALLNFGSLRVLWVPFRVEQSSSFDLHTPAAVGSSSQSPAFSSSGSCSPPTPLPLPLPSPHLLPVVPGPWQTLAVQHNVQPFPVTTATLLQDVLQSISVLQPDQPSFVLNQQVLPPQNQSTCPQVSKAPAQYQVFSMNTLGTSLVPDPHVPPNTPGTFQSSTSRTNQPTQNNKQNPFSRKQPVLTEPTGSGVSARPESLNDHPLPSGPPEPSQPTAHHQVLLHKPTKDQLLFLTGQQTPENQPVLTQNPAGDPRPDPSAQPESGLSAHLLSPLHKHLIKRHPILTRALLGVDSPEQNCKTEEDDPSPDPDSKPGNQQTPDPEPAQLQRESPVEEASEPPQTEPTPNRKSSPQRLSPGPPALSPVVRAVADSACDSSPQLPTLKQQEPSENEPTSTVLEEPEPAPEVPEKDAVSESLDLKLTQKQPVVPLFRLPLSHRGGTCPGFRLVPGEADDEIYLEELSEDSEDGTPDPPESPLTLQMVSCSACGSANGSIICSACGRGFHGDCHIPPVDQNIWMEWTCSLCQDLRDPWDPYSSNRPLRPPGPCLSVQEQRKCESLLLYLKVEGCRRLTRMPAVWSQLRMMSSRLTLHRSPVYGTPAELLWDTWRLFRDAVKEDDAVKSLQEDFQNKVTETFSSTARKKRVKPDRQRSKVTARTEGEERGGKCKLDKIKKRLMELIDIRAAKRRKMDLKTPPPSESHDQDL